MFALSLVMASFLAYSSILNVESTCYSETSVGFKQTIRRYYIPKDILSRVFTFINARKSVYAFTNLSSDL
jgi:hypothetical protein